MADTTEHRGYGLPNAGEPVEVDGAKVSEDLAIFQASIIAIDVDVHALFQALDGKANTNHTHAIGDVTGLETALAGKAAANHAHKLDDLTDVSGADGAPTTGTYTLIKTPAGWVPMEVAAILGDHSHTAADITDLETVLAAYAPLASPHLTGDPTAPTQSIGDNSTKLANTAFVQAEINATYTADDLLDKLLTVDGAGTGLDADLLDGKQGSYYTDIPARLGFTPFSNAGGSISGHTILSSSSDAAAISKGGGLGQLEIMGEGGRVAGLSFHRAQIFACNLGIDTDNQLKIGGWSMAPNSYKIWHDGNAKANCPHNSGVVEFGGVDIGYNHQTVDLPSPYVMVGLRSQAGSNFTFLRGIKIRNYA